MIVGLVKSEELSEAYQLFDEMPERDKVNWNKIGKKPDAPSLFVQIPVTLLSFRNYLKTPSSLVPLMKKLMDGG